MTNKNAKKDGVITDMMNMEERQEFKELFEIFAEFDTDGNGSISIQVRV